MDPEKLMNGISEEILATLKAMKNAKTPQERLMHSETVKNLCGSLEPFLSLMSEMMEYDGDQSIPF